MAEITTPIVVTGETANTFPGIDVARKILLAGIVDPLIDRTILDPESASYEVS